MNKNSTTTHSQLDSEVLANVSGGRASGLPEDLLPFPTPITPELDEFCGTPPSGRPGLPFPRG
jgi:hypothetical protein